MSERALHPLATKALLDPTNAGIELDRLSDRAELVRVLEDLCRVIAALRAQDAARARNLQSLAERTIIRFRERRGELHRLDRRVADRAAQFRKFVAGS